MERISSRLCAVFAVVLMCMFASPQVLAKPMLLLSAMQIKSLAAQPLDWAKLRQRCDRDLSWMPQPVAEFAPYPHYSADGANSPDLSGKALASDSHVAYRTALCFLLSGDARYAQKSQSVIEAWSHTMERVSNDQGAADINFNFPQFIIAASWVSGVEGWDATPFKKYLTTMIKPLTHSAKPNNRGNWGVLLDASIAAFTEDSEMLNAAKKRWQELLLTQVAADGSLPLEICRSNNSDHCGGADKGVNGVAYTHYALLPSAVAAQLFLSVGADVYHSLAGNKLGKAFGQAAKWTNDPASFPFFASNHGKPKGVDRCSYFALLGQHYPNAEAKSATCSGDIYELQTLFP